MRTFDGWLRPPRLRSGEGVDDDRHATWLELFFDLVFVVAVAELAHTLSAHLSVAGVLGFVALFVPVWWAWIGSTFYATRFDTDDVEYRLLTAVEIFGVIALAVNIHDGLGSTSAGFALAYAGVRGVLVFKYYRAMRHIPEARPLTTRFARGFGLAALIWFASAFVPVPYRFGLWAIGLAVDFGTPISAGTLHAELPPHPSHLPERFGLFTIIVLGEAIVGVVGGIAAQEWTATSVLIGAFGTAIAFSLWWIYFDNHDGSAVRAAQAEGRIWTYQEWLYLHLPLVVGLTAAGVGVLHVLSGDLAAPLPPAERWLLCGSLALCLATLGLLHRTTLECAGDLRPGAGASLYRFGAAGFVLLVALVGGSLPPVALVGLLALACAAQVGADLRAREPEAVASSTD
ncbi:low temperature requirement protein A [Halegenticoccus soli]|uniref:low temperature requirement protein A n=1 Tax=Halegenticoccus soli TaxID=1985678 RepID=UPI0018ECCE7E|nr:low temperature requirement protein A [Halegenticoccus soli]